MDGTGASLNGARWNSPGAAPIYAAENYSAAYLELLIKVGTVALGRTYHYCRIEVPEEVQVENSDFPLDQLESEAATRGCGNQWWKQKRTALLRVPSAVTRVDSNFLINPHHSQFPLLRVSAPELVWVDPRIAASASGIPRTRLGQ